jgi:hypothetical protein
VDDENDRPARCRQSPPRSESGFVMAPAGGEHDCYRAGACGLPPICWRARLGRSTGRD